MTSIENYFLQTLDYFDKKGVDVMVQGSTLLNIIRKGNIYPREISTGNILTEDKEINLYILAEDFTDALYVDMKKTFPYFNPINDKMPNSGIFFAQAMWNTNVANLDHWNIEPGFTYLNRLWQGRTMRFKYQGGENCITIPNKYVSDKSKWDTIYYLDRAIKVPANHRKYLTYYYGDWETEDMGWHWSKSKNYTTFDELYKRKEVVC